MHSLSVEQIGKKEKEFNLTDISFTQNKAQNIAIAGATGSGKSTLLKIIAGLVQPDAGAVFFEGKKVVGPDDKLIPGHPRIAYLSQHFELRNNYRVKDELSYTNQLNDADAHSIFEICRATHLLHRWTHQLSGGERQRIAMARQLISAPKLFLLDEPFSNLDQAHKAIIKKVIADISEQLHISCILVSHDPADILSWADEILILEAGKLIQKAPPKEVYAKPANAYAAGLLGAYNLISAEDLQGFGDSFFDIPDGKNLLLRPGQFTILPPEENAAKGLVKKVLYFGSWYEAEVQVFDTIIRVRTSEANVTAGDIIGIAFNSNDGWYV